MDSFKYFIKLVPDFRISYKKRTRTRTTVTSKNVENERLLVDFRRIYLECQIFWRYMNDMLFCHHHHPRRHYQHHCRHQLLGSLVATKANQFIIILTFFFVKIILSVSVLFFLVFSIIRTLKTKLMLLKW